MNLQELSDRLIQESPGNFEDALVVKQVIETHISCLAIDGGDRVIFNHKAQEYAKHSVSEREVDVLLHEQVPDMKKFELYPHISLKTSRTCPADVPWRFIPREEAAVRDGRDPYRRCDYSSRQSRCWLGCGITKEKIVELEAEHF